MWLGAFHAEMTFEGRLGFKYQIPNAHELFQMRQFRSTPRCYWNSNKWSVTLDWERRLIVADKSSSAYIASVSCQPLKCSRWDRLLFKYHLLFGLVMSFLHPLRMLVLQCAGVVGENSRYQYCRCVLCELSLSLSLSLSLRVSVLSSSSSRYPLIRYLYRPLRSSRWRLFRY